MDLGAIQVSQFRNARSVREPSVVSVLDELSAIKEGRYRVIIQRMAVLRGQGQGDRANGLKRTSLPGVTWSGLFSKRQDDSLIRYSALLVIDLDHIPDSELEEWRSRLDSDPYVLALWRSPSMNGLKLLIQVGSPPELHKLDFASFRQYLIDVYACTYVDPSGSNISRLCFTSWDPSLTLKLQSQIFFPCEEQYQSELTDTAASLPFVMSRKSNTKVSAPHPMLTEGRNRSVDRAKVTKIIRYLKLTNRSITSDFDSWVSTAFAIASAFTSDLGLKYYLELCRLDGPRFDEAACKRTLSYAYEHLDRKRTSFRRIVTLAVAQGFIEHHRQRHAKTPEIKSDTEILVPGA